MTWIQKQASFRCSLARNFPHKRELLSILISEISDERIGKQEKGIGAFRANAYSQQPAVRAAARVCGFWKLTLFSRFPERFDAKFEKIRRKAPCHKGLRRRFDIKSVRFMPLKSVEVSVAAQILVCLKQR